MSLAGKRVVVVGLGASGVAAARLCLRRGARVVGDRREAARGARRRGARARAAGRDARRVGGHAQAGLSRGGPRRRVARRPAASRARRGRAARRADLGEVELAVRALAHPAPVVAVGGTNGKSTTTSLVGALLEAHGLRTSSSGGNLGEPLANHADERFDAIVLEVSSFQMERVDAFRPRRVASCSTSPTTTSTATRASTAYAHAKGNAFARQTPRRPRGRPRRRRRLPARRRGAARARVVTFGAGRRRRRHADAIVDRSTGERYARPDIALAGGHNALNVAAAIAASVRASASRRRPSAACSRPSAGLPHRMALVARDRRRPLLRRLEGDERRRGRSPRSKGSPSRRPCSSPAGATRAGATRRSSTRCAAKGRAAVLIGEAADAIAERDRRRVPVHRARDARRGRPRERGDSPGRATPSCSRPRARASTCSATTSTAATSSSRAVRELEARARDESPAERPQAARRARSSRRSTRPRTRARRGRRSTPCSPRSSSRSIGFGVVMVYSASAVAGDRAAPRPAVLPEAPGGLRRRRRSSSSSRRAASTTTASTSSPTRCSSLVGLLLLACVVGFGHSGGGAARWLSVGPVHIQPAEMAKVALVIWLAYSLAKKAERVKTFTVGFLPHLIVAGVFMLLCMKQPDFGSAVVLLLLTFTLLFVAGAQASATSSARRSSASCFGVDRRSASASTATSGTSRGSTWTRTAGPRLPAVPVRHVLRLGRACGAMGLGRGLQTLYLPEAHTDFVAAIIGEELGFVGVLALCAAYLLLVVRGVRAALRAPDDYGELPGVRDRDDVRRAGAREPGGRARDPADQGADVAVRELRRVVAPRERGGGGHPPQRLAPGQTRGPERETPRGPDGGSSGAGATRAASPAHGPREARAVTAARAHPHRGRRDGRPRLSRLAVADGARRSRTWRSSSRAPRAGSRRASSRRAASGSSSSTSCR